MTLTHLPLEKIPLIESTLRSTGSLRSACLETGFAQRQILNLLQKKYQTKSWRKIKNEMGLKKPLSSLQKEKILTAKKFYEELGTLEAAGKAMSITRERVRQLLIKGVDHGLFEYTLDRDRRFEYLLKQFPREKISMTIEEFPSTVKASEKLGITASELERLMAYFSINFGEHKLAVAKKRYIEQYSKMVSELGYDPPTTEMQKKPEWRATWAGIGRLWGNMSNFRREFGIVATYTRRIEHMRQLGKKYGGNSGWKKHHEKLRKEKGRKKNVILGLFSKNSVLNFSQILAKFDGSDGTLYRYLDEMISEKSVVRHGSGRKVKYSLPGTFVQSSQNLNTQKRQLTSSRWLKASDVFSCFDDKKALSSTDIAHLLGRNRFNCWKRLKRLCLEGKVVRFGSGKSAKYCLPGSAIPVNALTENRQKRTENILSLFSREPEPLSLKQIIATLGITDRMCWPVLKELQNENKIKKVGSGKFVRYCLPEVVVFNDHPAEAKQSRILSQFENSNIISLKEFAQLTGYSTAVCWNVLKQLWKMGKIVKVGSGNRVKYKLGFFQNESAIDKKQPPQKPKVTFSGGENMNAELENITETESKQAKFKRLAERRVNVALDKIRLIGNLSSPQYGFMPEQVDKIIIALQEAISEVESKFRKPLDRKKQRFELT